MKGVRGFFVCKKPDHNANESHSREEVSAATKKLNIKHPTALLTEEDNAFIAHMLDKYESDQSRTDGDESNWSEEAW